MSKTPLVTGSTFKFDLFIDVMLPRELPKKSFLMLFSVLLMSIIGVMLFLMSFTLDMRIMFKLQTVIPGNARDCKKPIKYVQKCL